jgi:4-hydroxy-tetrahydrodipicolinate synthase
MSIVERPTHALVPATPSGVFCAALTPLNDSLEPDVPAAATHCARLLAAGCNGINLLGTTGEATSLSTGQRIAVMSGIAAAGLPLARFMVGTGAAALEDAVRLTSEALALGFAGQLVIPPFYFKDVLDDGVFRYYAELITRVGDPRMRLFFYNFPQLSGVTIAPAVVARVMDEFPNIVAGLKDSSGAADYAAGVAKQFPGLAVFPSAESGLDTARASGFAGCISATVNVTVPLAARVWAGSAAPADIAALRFLRETIVRYPLIPALRYLTSIIQNDDGWRRMLPPLAPLAPEQCAALDVELAANDAFRVTAAGLAA